MTCPKCGTPLADTMAFCPTCGTARPVPSGQPTFIAPPAYQAPPPGPYVAPNPYAQQAAGQKSGKKALFALLAAVLVIALVVTGFVAFWPRSQSAAPAAPSGSSVVVTDAAIQIGKTDAPVVVQVFVDYMCPYCGQFDRANGEDLATLVAAGSIRLDLHPMSFLDKASTSQYSTRAANAVVTVAKKSPGQVLDFHNALFASQPSEGSAGLSDDLLKSLAAQVGVPATVANTFAAGENAAWIQAATQADFAAGITGTPTILINGQKYTGNPLTKGPLLQAILAAGAPAPAPTPSR